MLQQVPGLSRDYGISRDPLLPVSSHLSPHSLPVIEPVPRYRAIGTSVLCQPSDTDRTRPHTESDRYQITRF